MSSASTLACSCPGACARAAAAVLLSALLPQPLLCRPEGLVGPGVPSATGLSPDVRARWRPGCCGQRRGVGEATRFSKKGALPQGCTASALPGLEPASPTSPPAPGTTPLLWVRPDPYFPRLACVRPASMWLCAPVPGRERKSSQGPHEPRRNRAV